MAKRWRTRGDLTFISFQLCSKDWRVLIVCKKIGADISFGVIAYLSSWQNMLICINQYVSAVARFQTELVIRLPLTLKTCSDRNKCQTLDMSNSLVARMSDYFSEDLSHFYLNI